MPSRVKRGQTLELTPEEVHAVLAAAGMRARDRFGAEAGQDSATACRTARGRVRRSHGQREPAPQARCRRDGAPAMSPTRTATQTEPHVIEPGNSAARRADARRTRRSKSFFKQDHGRPHGRPQGQARAAAVMAMASRRGAHRQQQRASARWQTGARRSAGSARSGSGLAVCNVDDPDHPWRVARGAARHGQRSPAWGTAGTSRPAASEGAAGYRVGQAWTRPAPPRGAAHQAGRPPKIRVATKHRAPSPRRPTTTRATAKASRPPSRYRKRSGRAARPASSRSARGR